MPSTLDISTPGEIPFYIVQLPLEMIYPGFGDKISLSREQSLGEDGVPDAFAVGDAVLVGFEGVG